MDQALVRAGLIVALDATPDIVVVADVVGGAAAREIVLQSRPDLLLVGGGRPAGTPAALDLCRSVTEGGVRPEVLLLTTAPDVGLVREALASGASGVFDDDLPLSLLARAIRSVHAGELWVPRALVGPIVRELTRASVVARTDQIAGAAVSSWALSARELEVLDLLADGKDHTAIADQLFLSPHTAKTHIRNVLRKLGVHSRLDAVLYAIDQGLIEPRSVAGQGRNARATAQRPPT